MENIFAIAEATACTSGGRRGSEVVVTARRRADKAWDPLELEWKRTCYRYKYIIYIIIIIYIYMQNSNR